MPYHEAYPYYGARGIKIAEEWREDFWAFANYIEQLPGSTDAGATLDRINGEGHYEPGNLRWASKALQSLNTRLRDDNVAKRRGIAYSSRDSLWYVYYTPPNRPRLIQNFQCRQDAEQYADQLDILRRFFEALECEVA